MQNFVRKCFEIICQIYPIYVLSFQIFIARPEEDFVFICQIILLIIYAPTQLFYFIFGKNLIYKYKLEYFINLSWIIRTVVVLIALLLQIINFKIHLPFYYLLINISLSSVVLVFFEQKIWKKAYKFKNSNTNLQICIMIVRIHIIFYTLIFQFYFIQYITHYPQIIISIILSIYLIRISCLQLFQVDVNIKYIYHIIILQGIINAIDLNCFYQTLQRRLQVMYILSLLNLINLGNIEEVEVNQSREILRELIDSNQYFFCQSCNQKVIKNDEICYFTSCEHIIHKFCKHPKCINKIQHKQKQKLNYQVDLIIEQQFSKYHAQMNKVLLNISLVGILVLQILIPYIQPDIYPKLFLYFSVILVIIPMLKFFYFGIYLINAGNFYNVKRRIIFIFEGFCIGFCLLIQFWLLLNDQQVGFYSFRMLSCLIFIAQLANFVLQYESKAQIDFAYIFSWVYFYIFVESPNLFIFINAFNMASYQHKYLETAKGLIQSVIIFSTLRFIIKYHRMSKQTSRFVFNLIIELILVSFSIAFPFIYYFDIYPINKFYFFFQINLSILLVGIKFRFVFYQKQRQIDDQFEETKNLQLLLYRGFQLETQFMCLQCGKIQEKQQVLIYFVYCQHAYHEKCLNEPYCCFICQKDNRFIGQSNPIIKLTQI